MNGVLYSNKTLFAQMDSGLDYAVGSQTLSTNLCSQTLSTDADFVILLSCLQMTSDPLAHD